MINAKQELKHALKVNGYRLSDIHCAEWKHLLPNHVQTTGHLQPQWSMEELQQFLDDLDFSYDNVFDGQELQGTIWMRDGTWFTRDEYDGSEWWACHKRPPVPGWMRT